MTVEALSTKAEIDLRFINDVTAIPRDVGFLLVSTTDRLAGPVARHAGDAQLGSFRCQPLGLADGEGPYPDPDAGTSADTPVVVAHRHWLGVVSDCIGRGFNTFLVLPIIDLAATTRECIVSYEREIIFLPNYKVMYSSFSEYFKGLPPSSRCTAETPGVLSRVDLASEALAPFLKFSVVRNPWDRLVSCYNDKIERRRHTPSFGVWGTPISRITGGANSRLLSSPALSGRCRTAIQIPTGWLSTPSSTTGRAVGSLTTSFSWRLSTLESPMLSRQRAYTSTSGT